MRVVIVEPKKQPYIKTVNDKLEDYQEIVGGWIESVTLSSDVILICNEEGKIMGLEPNRDLGFDVICGTFFLVGNDAPEFRDLTDAECERLIKKFSI